MTKPRRFNITRALERLEKRGIIKVINHVDTPEGKRDVKVCAGRMSAAIDEEILEELLATHPEAHLS